MTSSKAQIALVDPADTIFVMGAAIFTTLLSEESLSKKIDKTKDTQLYTGAAAKNKTQEKKLVHSENLLKQYQQDLTRSRMASTFFVALFMVIFMSILSSIYTGVVVAKLPFEPISFFRGITHRNILGTDYTDCSMIFIYILSNISLRTIIQKVLGVAGPRTNLTGAPSFFGGS